MARLSQRGNSLDWGHAPLRVLFGHDDREMIQTVITNGNAGNGQKVIELRARTGIQRPFCQSWEDADARVEAEKPWLRKHHHTLIEAFIVEADELKKPVRRKPP
jgi:hypothetical protein